MLSLGLATSFFLPTIALHPKPKNLQAYVINVNTHHWFRQEPKMNPKPSDYQKQLRYQENEILEHAAEILATRYVRGDALTNPDATKEYGAVS